jgi:hypothetical protein
MNHAGVLGKEGVSVMMTEERKRTLSICHVIDQETASGTSVV